MPEKLVAFLFVVCSGAGFEIALPEEKALSLRWSHLPNDENKNGVDYVSVALFQFKEGDYRRKFRFSTEKPIQ